MTDERDENDFNGAMGRLISRSCNEFDQALIDFNGMANELTVIQNITLFNGKTYAMKICIAKPNYFDDAEDDSDF